MVILGTNNINILPTTGKKNFSSNKTEIYPKKIIKAETQIHTMSK